MPLNKSKGNMFDFVTHTWNPIFGRCSHKCGYCYMKPFFKDKLYFKSQEVKLIKLGEGKTIFIGSSTDMFAEEVFTIWVNSVLRKCKEYDKNTYLFQTKNPKRANDFRGKFPTKVIFGTTIETNRKYKNQYAPTVYKRATAMLRIADAKTVTIEPIMDFDLKPMVHLIEIASPEFVSIGADSKGHNLPEPSRDKVEKLIEALEKFTEVRVKLNLNRLIRESK